MTSNLLLSLREVMSEELNYVMGKEERVAVAFSGGVDSSLLAKMCKDLNKSVTLLTVGFANSHDMIFSGIIASKMLFTHKKYEIQRDDFYEELKVLERKIECNMLSHIENCVAYFFIAQLARENDLRTVLTANGLDELFCGYNQYRVVYARGESAIMKLMESKIKNELSLLEKINRVASDQGISIKSPFLTDRFVKYAYTIPLNHKITGNDDLLRKHIIRRLAADIGIPQESAMKPKKALQYGSLIHKYFMKRNCH